MNNNFDFLVEPQLPPDSTPEYIGPNIKTAVRMTPKKFALSVLEVFDKLGGASWLMTQAEADPHAFLDLLKRMIPKSIQLEDLHGIQVNLIDQFGNEVQIQTGDTAPPLQKSGQLRIATGGSPPSDLASSTGQKELPSMEIKDIFT